MPEQDSSLIISERIKGRRTQMGMSLQTLSEKTGISKSTLQRYENNGDNSVPADKLITIANALRVMPLWLIGGDSAYPSSANNSFFEFNEFVSAISRITSADAQKLLGLILIRLTELCSMYSSLERMKARLKNSSSSGDSIMFSGLIIAYAQEYRQISLIESDINKLLSHLIDDVELPLSEYNELRDILESSSPQEI